MPTGRPVFGSIGQELIVSFTNRTEPSTMAKLAPPGCMLDAAWMNAVETVPPPALLSPTLRWGLTG